MTYSGCRDTSSVQLIASQTLDFPSASGIEFYEGKLYIFGDNAPHLLELSTRYKVLGKIAYWPDTSTVISKETKPDIESALLTEAEGKPILLGVSSLSGPNRWPVYAWIPGSDTIKTMRLFSYPARFPGIAEVNIEGSTAVGKTLVFCNRANLTNKTNQFIFRESETEVTIKDIRLPVAGSKAGLSGLFYIAESDLLLFTASEEATYNAMDDGEIGESYLGWIQNFSSAKKEAVIPASDLLKLTQFSPEFKGQKIEGVCAESVDGNRHRLHLVADNDNGSSKIFTIDLRL